MTTTWRAPGRVNLIGEHTDYNDGFVLPFALPLGVTAQVDLRDDDVVQVSSEGEGYHEAAAVRLDELAPGNPEGWAAYAAGAVWALREAGHDVGGVDVRLAADLPPGAGLSSSAAVECAVAGAVAAASGIDLAEGELVTVAHRAETGFVGVPVGLLDQSAVVRCTEAHALFLDVRSGEARQVPLDLAAAGLVLLVIDTRAPHRLVDGEYARRREQCAAAAAALGVDSLRDVVDDVDVVAARLTDDVLRRRAVHILTENQRVLDTVAVLDAASSGTADVRDIGPLLTASHVSLRDDYEVSSHELDLAVSTALDHGAHGARMTGGGFGGSAIALVDADAADDVGRAVADAFAAAGLTAPHAFPVVPAAGAGPA